MNIWAELGIAPTTDQRTIRRAYAARLKHTSPEDDRHAFQRLREAYEAARVEAQYLSDQSDLDGDKPVGAEDGEGASSPSAAEANGDAEALRPYPPELRAAHFIEAAKSDDDVASIAAALEFALTELALYPPEERLRFEDALLHGLSTCLPVPLPLIDAASSVFGWERAGHRCQSDGRWLLLEQRVFLAQAEHLAGSLVERWTEALSATDINDTLLRLLSTELLNPFRVREHFERGLIAHMLQREVLPLSLAESAFELLDWHDERHPLRQHPVMAQLLDRMDAMRQAKAAATALVTLREIEQGGQSKPARRALALLRKPPKPAAFWLLRRHGPTSEAVKQVIETLTMLDGKAIEQEADAASLAWWRAALARPAADLELYWIQGLGVVGGLIVGIAGSLRRWLFEDLRWFGSPWPITALIALVVMVALCLAAWGLVLASQWWRTQIHPGVYRWLTRIRHDPMWQQSILVALALLTVGSAALPWLAAQFACAVLAGLLLAIRHGRSILQSLLRSLLLALLLSVGLFILVFQDAFSAVFTSLLLATAGHAQLMRSLPVWLERLKWSRSRISQWVEGVDVAWWALPLVMIFALTIVLRRMSDAAGGLS